MTNLLDALKKLGPAKLAAMGGTLFILLVFFVVLMARVSGQEMQVLYADLDPVDANQIIAQVETMGVRYALEENGSIIKVAPADIGRVRIKMAEAGLPRGGNLGYELFDRDQGLGTSNFVQNISKVRALEGELARTIASIEHIRNARVHLVLPTRELFSRDKQSPTASVFLHLVGNRELAKNQVQAIQYLISSAVPELAPGAVSIVDARGNLIARGEGERDTEQMALASAEEARIAYETRMQREIESMLESVVGYGKVRAQVTAEMDFDKVVINAELYDPEGQVVRSVQTAEENEQDSERTRNVTIENNLPEAQAGEDGEAGNQRAFNRLEETTNFEISRTVKNQVRQSGGIRRLSVAVLIDGTYALDEEGVNQYQPRSEEQLARIDRLVKSAIGYDEEREDRVEVLNMQFASIDDSGFTEPGFWETLDFSQYAKIIETLILAVIGLLVILLVVRPLMGRLLEPLPAGAGAEGSDALLAASGALPALEAPDGSTLPVPYDGGNEEMIDLDRIDGQMKASSVRKIGEIIDKHPEEAMQILRAWMYEEA